MFPSEDPRLTQQQVKRLMRSTMSSGLRKEPSVNSATRLTLHSMRPNRIG